MARCLIYDQISTIMLKFGENWFSTFGDNLSQKDLFLEKMRRYKHLPFLKLRGYWTESHQIFTRCSANIADKCSKSELQYSIPFRNAKATKEG